MSDDLREALAKIKPGDKVTVASAARAEQADPSPAGDETERIAAVLYGMNGHVWYGRDLGDWNDPDCRIGRNQYERNRWMRQAEHLADALAEAGLLRDEKAEQALARVEALADEMAGEARAHREAGVRDADIERDWIAGRIEHTITRLRAALRGDR